MPVRPLRSLVTILVCITVLTGCTADAEPASQPAAKNAAAPVVDGFEWPSGSESPTTVTASDELREPPAQYLGAMHLAEPVDGEAVLPTRENAAAVITAFDDEGNVLGRAVSVSMEGLPREGDMTVDYTSTAFTRLITTPPFLTDNPLAITLIRGAAAESKNLPRLAAAIKANAATNAGFETAPTTAERNALVALVKDVRGTLARTASQMPPTQATGAARSAPAWAMTAEPTLGQCLDRLGPNNTYGDGSAPVCVKADQVDDTYVLNVENTAAVWGLIYTEDTNSGRGRIAGVVNPYTFTLPSIDTIITAILYSTTKMIVSEGIDMLCEGYSWFGGECPETWTEEFDPSKWLTDLWDEVKPSRPGGATVYLDEGDLTGQIAVFTPGIAASTAEQTPSPFAAATSDEAIVGLKIMSLYSSVLEPLIGLLAGDSVDELVPEGRADGPANIECPIPSRTPKRKGEPKRCTPEGSLFGAVVDALRKSENLSQEANALSTTVLSDSLEQSLPAMADLALKVVTDKAVMTALLRGAADDLIAKGLENLLTTIGVSVIPGAGWLSMAKKVTDTAVGVFNVAAGAGFLITATRNTPDRMFFASVSIDPERILTDYDWASPEYTYEAYFNDGNGEGFLPFNLGNTTGMPGVSDISLLGATYGTIDGEPAALVAVEIIPDEALGAETVYVAAHLITVDPDTRTPVTKALLVDFPGYRYATKATYAIEDNEVVAYYTFVTGSSGAAQDDARHVFKQVEQTYLAAGGTNPYEDTEAAPRDGIALIEDDISYVPPAQARDGITWVPNY